MIWALINTIDMPLIYGRYVGDPVVWTVYNITAVPGTIMNIIQYDGSSPYSPEEGLSLGEVPDSAQIGDTGY